MLVMQIKTRIANINSKHNISLTVLDSFYDALCPNRSDDNLSVNV